MNTILALALMLLLGTIASVSLTVRPIIIASTVLQSQSTVLAGYAGRVKHIAFSPDGKTIAAVGDQEDAVGFWNVTTGERLRAPEGLATGVNCIAFSPDGNLIASGQVFYGRRPRLWEVASGKLWHPFGELLDTTYSVYSVAFSPDGKTIASGSGREIGIWDVATGKQLGSLEGHAGNIHSLAFSPDGKMIASGSEDETIKLWDAATGRQLRSLNNGWGTSLAFSSDGKLLVSNALGHIKLWDIATGNELRSLKDVTGVGSVAFSRDGKVIAGACSDRTIKLWDVATGKQLRSMTGHAGEVNAVGFSPDGKMIASGSDDHTIRLWDAATGTQIRVVLQKFSADARCGSGIELYTTTHCGQNIFCNTTARLSHQVMYKEWSKRRRDWLLYPVRSPAQSFQTVSAFGLVTPSAHRARCSYIAPPPGADQATQ